MKNNHSFSDLAGCILKSENIVILTHMLVDGDSAGSGMALCLAIRKLGKKCIVVPGEKLPGYLAFLDNRCFAGETGNENFDLCITVDCSDLSRLQSRKTLFDQSKTTMNIDHHKTNDRFADFNYIEENSAATGELVYDLIGALGIALDVSMAEGLYTAIVTDTGNFQYSNTSPRTHKIAATLIEAGVNVNGISIALYQSVRLEKIQITGELLNCMELFCEEKVVFTYASLEMLHRIGADVDETDGVIEMMRGIDSVEVAIFAKELQPGVMKVGFRSKRYVDVSEIAGRYGGGGHARAAGCSITGGIEKVREMIKGLDI